MRTPQIVLRPIGTRYPAISIPGSDQIRGVLIDNPSGSWILLRPTNDYIPPYTLGWARSFPGGIASVDVAYESPAGQVSTRSGDNAIIVLDTEPVEPSSGSPSGLPFIERFTPILQAEGIEHIGAYTLVGAVVLVPAVTGRRIRVRSLSVTKQANSELAAYQPALLPSNDSPVTIRIEINPTVDDSSLVAATLVNSNPSIVRDYDPGYDLALQTPLALSAWGAWASLDLFWHVMYELI